MRKLYPLDSHGAPAGRPASASVTQPSLLSLPNPPPPPAGEHEAGDDGQDLGELLQDRGFAHWRSLLDSLTARYAGWLTHYWVDDRFNLDVWPQADIIGVLVGMPKACAGDDLAFALALSQCDFLVRLARDEATGQPWNALSQSYAEFQREHQQAEPYWGHEAPWPPEVFARWALAQLPQRH